MESKQNDSKSSTWWCLIQTGQNHSVTTKAQKYMAIVNKQRKVKYRHANEYRQQIYAFEKNSYSLWD